MSHYVIITNTAFTVLHIRSQDWRSMQRAKARNEFATPPTKPLEFRSSMHPSYFPVLPYSPLSVVSGAGGRVPLTVKAVRPSLPPSPAEASASSRKEKCIADDACETFKVQTTDWWRERERERKISEIGAMHVHEKLWRRMMRRTYKISHCGWSICNRFAEKRAQRSKWEISHLFSRLVRK